MKVLPMASILDISSGVYTNKSNPLRNRRQALNTGQ